MSIRRLDLRYSAIDLMCGSVESNKFGFYTPDFIHRYGQEMSKFYFFSTKDFFKNVNLRVGFLDRLVFLISSTSLRK